MRSRSPSPQPCRWAGRPLATVKGAGDAAAAAAGHGPAGRPRQRPASIDFGEEVAKLKARIALLENDSVQAVNLNRTRMRIAIVLLNQAIMTLQRPGSGLNDFDRATEYIANADAYNVSIEAGVLNEEDRRVHADLQTLSRRAVGEQVIYLRRLLQPAVTAPPSSRL